MLMAEPVLHLKPSLWLTVFLFLVVSSPPAALFPLILTPSSHIGSSFQLCPQSLLFMLPPPLRILSSVSLKISPQNKVQANLA